MKYLNAAHRIFERWAGLSGGQKRFVIFAGSGLNLLMLGALWAGVALGGGGNFNPPFPWPAMALVQQFIGAVMVLALEIKAHK